MAGSATILKMKSKTKKILLVFLAGIMILGLILYFELSKSGTPPAPPVVNNGEEYGNPISKIVSPAGGSFQNGNFSIKVWDIDAGGSGIDIEQCAYSVYGCLEQECKSVFSNAERACNNAFWVRVGEKGDCSSEGVGACRIIVKSRDLTGNSNIVSDAEESLRDFSIDWTAPKVEIVTLSPITARVSDNIELSNCDLFVDGQSQYQAQKYLDFSEIACSSEVGGKCYKVSSDLILSIDKDHKLKLNCWDLAGNVGYSNLAEIKASANRKPEISYCKLSPVEGNLRSEFRFEVKASDPDNDTVSYLWDFGDGSFAEEMNPSHKYNQKGVFEPRVTVFDGKEETKCSTAWVNVVEE